MIGPSYTANLLAWTYNVLKEVWLLLYKPALKILKETGSVISLPTPSNLYVFLVSTYWCYAKKQFGNTQTVTQ